MPSTFVGRTQDLARLQALLDGVGPDPGPDSGQLVTMRGRRRVGKSRLVEEFIHRAGVPAVFHTASRQPMATELAEFSAEVAAAPLPGADLLEAARPESWDAALRLLAGALADVETPTVVVIDEFPYLCGDDGEVESIFQRHWDRSLSRLPVLLVLVGSDLAMMEALTTHDRPLYGRAREVVVEPFTPAETAAMLGLDGRAAFDAYLTVGGFPLVVADWDPAAPRAQYLADALADPTSPLIVTGERMLAAEFPAETNARAVLSAVGSGERTFSNIAASTGLGHASLSRSLDQLCDVKRVVTRARPLSTRKSNETRYWVADSYLRFWLRWIAPALARIERGLGRQVAEEIVADWSAYRGRAVEPLVREAVARLAPGLDALADAGAVGGFWTRDNRVEVDLVAADQAPVARRVSVLGSIKWRDERPFDGNDAARLLADRERVPGAETAACVGVSAAGFATVALDVALGPDDLLGAWPSAGPGR